IRMSALGHKQTFAVQKGMSALPPIADMKISLLHGAFLFETRTKAVFCFGVSVETRYMTALKGILRVGRTGGAANFATRVRSTTAR
ncbi:MAG: hypothetical protein WB614_11385, partial [Pseudolabrys sp.]